MMAEKNIKIVSIHADQLKTRGLSSNLVEFIPVLKRLKHLKDFYYRGDFYYGLPPLHLLKDLPIQRITTNEFKLERGKIENIVDILTQMKSLKQIHIYYDCDNEYQLCQYVNNIFNFTSFQLEFVGSDLLYREIYEQM